MFPWLINLGRAVGGFTGTRGAGKGAAKILEKGTNFDYDKVDGWKRPLWQRPTPVNGGVSRGPGGKFVSGARKQPGWINRMYMNPTTTTGSVARLAGLTAGGSIAADRIASIMEDDEVAPDDAKAMRSAIINSSTPDISKGIQNRLDYQKQMTAKMNKDMKKLIQYYGIVNLVNPDAAPDLLKLGTAMIDQDIKTMGDERQAKIFDSVFANGAPTNAMDAYQRVMQAGGTPEDAEQISGMVADASPTTGGSMNKAEMGQAYIQQAEQALLNGNDQGAKEIIIKGINAGILPQEVGRGGIKMTAKEQAEKFIEDMGGVNMSSNNAMNIRIKN